MVESSLFLIALLVVGFIAKNQSLMIAVGLLLALKFTGLGEKVFPFIQQKGINWGVTIITVAVLIPIATGEIGMKQLQESLKSVFAWVALASGIIVAILGANGIKLLQSDPQITTALVVGTILAIAVFNGVAVGPLIGAGIAYFIMSIVRFFGS
ncbi:DUF441 domain-containing protein [Fictibacillus sp. Mic-4]|uniref:DUF441 domain-containing protein n=1 Tax=Fictibacillus TaxID=1329200 RepID=UPI000410D1C1|nr:DUF441 domain-containing protein [Fictibacillus gelatini]